jgi:surface glycoprotein (TIGR04207 family)/PGF-CTERM protein
MTSTNDKVRSLILAALMVMSVFAGTVAFTGTAAAANSLTVDNGPTNSQVVSGQTVTHELNYTVTDLSSDGGTDTLTVTIPNGAEFVNTDDRYLYVRDANGDVIAGNGGNSDANFDSSPSVQGANNGTNNQLTFAVAPDNNFDTSEVTVDARFDIMWPEVDSETSGNVVFGVTDSNGDNLNVTASDVVTINPDESDEVLSEGSIVFSGQTVSFPTNSDSSNLVLVRNPDTDDETTVRSLRVENGAITIDTDGYQTDDYAIEDRSQSDTSGNDNDLVNFEIIVQDLSTEFDDETVDNDENTTLEVSSNRVQDFDVEVDADGLSTSALEDIFNTTANDDDEVFINVTDGSEVNANFDDVSAGDYQFNFSVEDTTAESSADISVAKAGTAELDLNESSYTVETGDTTNMTITFSETESGFIRIGDDDIGYNSTYAVEDGDEDGMLNVSFNSYNTSSNEGGLSLAEGEDGSVVLQNTSANANAENDFSSINVTGALDAGNYDVEVTRQAEDLGNGPDAVGTLAITERATTSAQPWVTFSDAQSDLDRGDDVIAAIDAGEVTQRRDVAEDDFAVIQFQVSGIFGYLESQNDLSGAFGDVDTEDPNEPVSLQVEEANPGANQEPDAYDLDDLTYILDDERNMLFVVVPTSGNNVPAEDGDRYNATLEVNAIDNDDVTLNDAKRDERVSTNFRVVEREAPLNTNEDGQVAIQQSEDGEVTGTTTIAPGSEITVRVRSVSGAENPFVMSETVNVSSDGTYNATFDFAETPVGTNFTATVSASPGLDGDDEFDGIVVEEETTTQSPTDTPTPTETDDSTPTPTATDDSTPTPTATDDGTPTPDEETTTTTPGFGAVVAVIALLGAALLALRRD